MGRLDGGGALPVIFCFHPCSHGNAPGRQDGADGKDHRPVTELSGEAERLYGAGPFAALALTC
jgi:hypothetical protein